MAELKIDGREVRVDSPLRLSVAAKLAFPDGTMTASGLRREAGRGNLVIERIAGKDYTTLASLDGMREKCRVTVKGRDCGGVPKDAEASGSSRAARGSSSTEADISPRDALLARIDKRTKR